MNIGEIVVKRSDVISVMVNGKLVSVESFSRGGKPPLLRLEEFVIQSKEEFGDDSKIEILVFMCDVLRGFEFKGGWTSSKVN